MQNEEMKAKLESLKTMDDVYQLAKDGGYPGSMDDFVKLVEQAAGEIDPMSMDDLEQVAGGGIMDTLSDAWDSVSSACAKGYNWVCENPELTAEIVGGVAAVGTAIGVGVYAYNSYNKQKAAIKAQEATSTPYWYKTQLVYPIESKPFDAWVSCGESMLSTGPFGK